MPSLASASKISPFKRKLNAAGFSTKRGCQIRHPASNRNAFTQIGRLKLYLRWLRQRCSLFSIPPFSSRQGYITLNDTRCSLHILTDASADHYTWAVALQNVISVTWPLIAQQSHRDEFYFDALGRVSMHVLKVPVFFSRRYLAHAPTPCPHAPDPNWRKKAQASDSMHGPRGWLLHDVLRLLCRATFRLALVAFSLGKLSQKDVSHFSRATLLGHTHIQLCVCPGELLENDLPTEGYSVASRAGT